MACFREILYHLFTFAPSVWSLIVFYLCLLAERFNKYWVDFPKIFGEIDCGLSAVHITLWKRWLNFESDLLHDMT